MKNLLIAILIIFYISSCDPKLPHAQFEGVTTITAKIINPRDSIGINDTVRIQFEVLDTIMYNGSKVNVSYSSKDVAYCNLKLWKIDTTFGGITVPTGSIIYAAVGQLMSTKVLNLQNNGNSVRGEYCFIPKSKGVYFIDQQLPGELTCNNNQYNLKTYWSYGNINRSHQMLIKSPGAPPNFNLFLQERINNNLEVYGFKVN